MVSYTPNRGDIVWLEFDPQKGREIQKTRPALVISPISYNSTTGLALFMPITSQVKGYPFEVIVDSPTIAGAVLSDQVRSLDWHARKARFITHISDTAFSEIMGKFKTLLA